MTRTVSRPEHRERGAVLVIFALALSALLGLIAIAIDLSYGFVQNRQAQNASDFAAFAAAQQLSGSTVCNGGSATPNMQQIVTLVQHVVNDNAPNVGSAWTAQFVDGTGHLISGSTFTPASSSSATFPPPGSCGVSVNAVPSWTPFLAGIFGVGKLSGDAKGVVSNSTQGLPIGIVALNKVGPHAVLGGGSGTFVVSGDMFLNTDVTNQPWTSNSGGWEWDDAVDAKTGSNLYVYGTIQTNNGKYNGESLWPLDGCFTGSGRVGQGDSPPAAFGAVYAAGDPGNQTPTNTLSCSAYGSHVTVDYDHINPAQPAINDPLQSAGAPPSPFTASIACPGLSAQTYSTAPTSGSLLPGEYTNPVLITGSMQFEDCSGYSGEAAYPGIYRFDQGLWIDPQSAGDTVTGSNIVIATKNPYPVAGNVPGAVSNGNFVASGGGNGAPCLPTGTMTSAPSGNGTPENEVDGSAGSACGGSSPQTYGVIAYGDSSFSAVPGLYGTGSNLSLIVGGVSGATVSLTGPTSGTYAGAAGAPGLVLYQDAGTQANYGFDAESGDAATISVAGVVYDSSLTSYGSAAPLDYWDGVGGGIPFYAGGTLQTGYGAGWSSGPAASAGSVTINGTCIVDDFNTDGATTITILGQPYSLPGSSGLSLIG